MTHLAEDLLRGAREDSAAPLLIAEDGSSFSYGEVALAARRVAGRLAEEGVVPDDRVLLLLPNGPDYLAAYYGVLLRGAVAVGLHTALTEREAREIAEQCDPSAVIGDAARSSGSGLEPGGTAWLRSNDLHSGPTYEGEPLGGGGSTAQIIYTSGTTGSPKGVMLSHDALRANTTSIVEYLGLSASDRVGVVLDFVYSYGNSLLQTHVRVGGSLALLGSLSFPVRVLELLADRRCTGLSGVPSTFALLLGRGGLEGSRLPDLRYVTCAGGALPPANLERLRRALPGVTVYLMYGQTEACARLGYLPPEELDRRPESIGRGIPGVTLEVLGPDGAPVEVGEEGEIVASGPNLMSGYWRDPVETATVLREGKLWTGDLATVDEEGFIRITGRRSDLIKTGAFRVHPKEVEEAMVTLDGVRECVVVGVPDAVWGEALVACFPEGTAPSLSRIRRHLRGLLPEHKWPRRVVEVPSIPRTPSGKPRRGELARLLTHDGEC